MICHQLTQGQRYQITKLISSGKSKAEIAKTIGVHRSTIYREVSRNSLDVLTEGLVGTEFLYEAVPAQGLTSDRRKEGCGNRFKVRGEAKTYVVEKLKSRWSPEQIAGRARLDDLHEITASSIYRFIENDRLDILGNKYYQLLRRYRKVRRRRRKKRVCRGRKGAPKKSIRERPKAADLRHDIGHFERDLMEGPRARGRAVLVLADRKSRYLFLRFVKKDGEAVQKSTANVLSLKETKRSKKSVTQDNGWEFIPAISRRAEDELGVPVYFCDPCSPWQRGTVENSIGLLRQYLPKKYDFSKTSPAKLRRIERQLNNRPRKVLNYKTPSEIYFSASNKKTV